jgi:hypothetical protein
MNTNPWPLINRLVDAFHALPHQPHSVHVLVKVGNDLHIVPRACVTKTTPILFTWTPIILAEGYSTLDSRLLEKAIAEALDTGLTNECPIRTDQADRTPGPHPVEYHP